MSDWYKMDPVAWNDGTENLTLEQEAAFLRICNAIHIGERPLRNNLFVVAGLLRCNERKARRLLDELVAAGKIVIDGDSILNRRAVEDVSNRVRLRADRKSAGSRGGVGSAKARSKTLETNNTGQAIASTPVEPDKIREEERRTPLTPRRFANPIVVLEAEVDAVAANAFASHCEQKGKRLSAETAEAIVGVLRDVRAAGGNPTEALRIAIRKGWVSLELEWLRNAGMKFSGAAPAEKTLSLEQWAVCVEHWRETRDWNKVALGPPPGAPGSRVPPELLTQAA